MRTTYTADTPLTSFVELYKLERSLSEKYISSLRATAKQLTAFAGGILPVKDLDAITVNEWLSSIEREHPITAANKKRHIKALWLAAIAAGIAPPIGTLRRIKIPARMPTALTMEQVAALVATAGKLSGKFRRTKISRRHYWKSLMLAYWDTALRLGDLRRLERQWIADDGTLGLIQHKTARVHCVQFRPQTMAEIDSLLDGRTTGVIWDVLNRKNFFTWQRRIFLRAGVPGTGRWMRRASASYVEAEHPGTGWRHLGHRGAALAETAYIDPRIARRTPTMPPALLIAKGGAA